MVSYLPATVVAFRVPGIGVPSLESAALHYPVRRVPKSGVVEEGALSTSLSQSGCFSHFTLAFAIPRRVLYPEE